VQTTLMEGFRSKRENLDKKQVAHSFGEGMHGRG
jgi:hypothetical protein